MQDFQKEALVLVTWSLVGILNIYALKKKKKIAYMIHGTLPYLWYDPLQTYSSLSLLIWMQSGVILLKTVLSVMDDCVLSTLQHKDG